MASRAHWLPALGAFEAAARHQNFAHAARELHLTASAVSHHVRKLESALGITLFQRHARGVLLTPEGRLLADAAGGALTDLDTALDVLRSGRRERRSTERLRITTLHSLAYTWLIPRLPRFASLQPRVRLNIDTSTALTRFDEGGPDLGIRHGAGNWPGLIAQHLMDDELFPVAAPDLPGVERIAEPAQIARLPLVTDLALQGWRDWFRAAGVRGVRLSEMHTFGDSTDALMAAICRLGAVLARKHIVRPYLTDGRLRRLPGPVMTARFAYYAVYPSHRRLSPAGTAFIDWLRQEAQAE